MRINVYAVLDAMAKKEVNQTALAKKSGVTRQAINNVLKGQKRGVRIDTIGKLAAALDVPPLELIQK
ncbi:helix-turn-helix transcriptional regulator [Acidaminococcus fermentans]|uniref:Helix-turn-helix transcriptional regulator n=1 Tax=Acidaminococcus fermentans TaxID=905 RepID=A0A6N7W065_ACIFE|nr:MULTISPECIES: helix-turn-helix transcriptional regulator [Acidaminococcus]MCI7195494.1 helix-turn-helix transcriptional regulator [Acidaminococcus fermentans]MSS81586.1 helix-turn-helix transcriptional regulator [Acidaminococcus fermentans]CDE94702.1 unknown [Acidaminococcus sp. CAG:542]